MTHDPGWMRYADAGVNIDAGEAVVAAIRERVARTHSSRVIGGLGHFGGFYRIGEQGSSATLVASTDGVGTKLKVAVLARKHDTIGADIVNHCINDIMACGAEPLFFLDYFATGRLDPEVAITVIGGIASACEAAGVALIGGETAEMPGVYSGDDYDLAGTIVGIVQEERIIDGRDIQVGDVLLGLPSSGFHTNGYSLVRSALRLNEGEAAASRLSQPAPFAPDRTLAEVLLEPHRLYQREIIAAVASGDVRGMAHITGGGLPGNVQRIVPNGMAAVIDTRLWRLPEAFGFVAEAGHIPMDECFRAFNMGIGYVIVCARHDVEHIRAAVPESMRIGEIVTSDAAARVKVLGVKAD